MSDNDSYKIPNDYFKNLHGQINSKIDLIEDDLQTNAPLLFDISKQKATKEAYLIPDNYFKNNLNKKSWNKQSNVVSLRRRILSVAAVFILLAACMFLFDFNQSPTEQTQLSFVDDNMYEYLMANPEEIDDELLYEMSGDLSFENIDGLELDELLESMSELEIIEL